MDNASPSKTFRLNGYAPVTCVCTASAETGGIQVDVYRMALTEEEKAYSDHHKAAKIAETGDSFTQLTSPNKP